MRSEQIAERVRGKIENIARELIQIEAALEDLKPPNPHFMYADIGDRLRLLANGGDGVLQVLERHLSESVVAIQSGIGSLKNHVRELEGRAFELKRELREELKGSHMYREIAQEQERVIKDRHHKNLIEIKELIQRIDPPDMATEQSVGTQVYSLLDRFLAEFEPSETNQEET